jgi:hypothetical protein
MMRPADSLRLVATCLLVALAACDGAPGPEISSTPPYKDFIGAEYRVVGDQLRASGVYASPNERTALKYVNLLPFGVGGREIAFDRPVPRGQVLKIIGAWRKFRSLDPTVYYLVMLEHSDLPTEVPTRLVLTGDNVGAGGDLNPAIFERLPTRP